MPLTESDTCMRFITPALEAAGWDKQTQIRSEYALTSTTTTTESVPT